MPIAALPDETRRLLGSTSTITTPVSLVKELLDNAIDANATTIEVLVSPNTLDKIEVRDNGTGIHSDDYDCLGRRGYTSKLRTFDDLQNLAGTTLGFRGEALASANTLGKVCIITKTSSDSIAAVLHLNPKDGGILEQEAVAAPIGTTVRVSRLYHEIPVRHQAVIKEARNTIEKIKHLLFSYVMAKPHIKMAFKVYKQSNSGWSYSPRQPATLKEATIQILGKEGASHCIEKNLDGSSPESLEMTAMVCRPDAEILRLPKHRYFSVDGRPVSGSAGTMRKLFSIYQKHLESTLPDLDRKALNIGDAFLCVNFVNPGRYDVNIATAKDEVLFEDEEVILRHFEKFCEQIYGPLSTGGRHEIPLRRAQALGDVKRAETGENGPRSSVPSSGWTAINTSVTQMEPMQGAVISGGLASGSFPADPAVFSTTMSDDISDQFAGPDVSTNNCSPIMKNRSRPLGDSKHEGIATVQKEVEVGCQGDSNCKVIMIHPDVANNQGKRTAPLPGIMSALQLSNMEMRALSMTTPEPEILRHRGAPPGDLDMPPSMRLLSNCDYERDLTNNDLETTTPRSDPNGLVSKTRNNSKRRQAQPPWTPPSSVQRNPDQWQGRYTSTNRTKRDGLKQGTISFGGNKDQAQARGKQKCGGTNSNKIVSTEKENGHSFNDLSQNLRSTVSYGLHHTGKEDLAPPHQPQSATQLPRRNDFTQLRFTELETNDPMTNKSPIMTSLESGDPRAYLLRRQKSIEAEEASGRPRKLKRTKSLLLPLENVVEIDQTRHLMLVLQLSISQILTCTEEFRQFDRYVVEGDIEEALDMSLSEARRIEKSCDNILASWSDANGDGIQSKLSSVLKGKSVGVSE